MNNLPVRPVLRRLGTGLLAVGLLGAPALFLAPRARAADAPPEGEDLQAKIQKKMQEILRLMRENGKAILDASQGGGAKPKGVEVTPPPPDGTSPPGTPPPAGTPPGGTPPPEGTPPGGSGDDVRRRMDELLKQMSSGGAAGAIPKELEELVRMIPKKSSNSSDGSQPPEPDSRKPGEKPKDPQDDPSKTKDPKQNPERDPKPKDGDKPPPDGAKEPPRDDDTPPWAAELPPEVRRVALNASPEKVPERYRSLLIRYQKWLQERAAKGRDGR